MARKEEVELRRAANLRTNLRRIFDAWGNQIHVARDAGLGKHYLARLLSGELNNPTINSIESIAIALEVPIEALIATDPADSDLRISPQISKQPA